MGTTTAQEHSAIYIFIYVCKQYLQLINWHKIVTYILILTFFFLKTANLIINWLVVSGVPQVVLKDHPQHLTEYEGKGTKISICKLFNKLGKNWKCHLRFSKVPISHLFYALEKTWKYTQPKTNISKSRFRIFGWIRKIYVLIKASLVKIKWGIHIKKNGHILSLT